MIEQEISLNKFPLNSRVVIELVPYGTSYAVQAGSLLAGKLVEPRQGWLQIEDAVNETAWMLGKIVGLGYGIQTLDIDLAPRYANSLTTRVSAVALGFQAQYYLPFPEAHKPGSKSHRYNYEDLPLAFSRLVVNEAVIFDMEEYGDVD